MHRFLRTLALLLALCAFAHAADLPEKAPSADAKPHTWHATTAKSGLRYAWLVPKGYDGKTPRNLTVILHGTGLDHRWGPANHKAGVFRPDDVVVSLDGPSPGPNDSRLFLGEKKDVEAVAAFLEEMRAAFAIDRAFLYGHSQGGFFVVHFAGERPESVAGVVAHASGAWNHSKRGSATKKVAIAFQHGTLDPVVPYVQSPGSRDVYVEAGFPLVHLRRLETYNHWPNAVRSTESLDWCEGMTTSDPARALELAERIVTPKKADEYQWTAIVGFAAARDVLRRFDAKGKAPFADVPDALSKKAQALVAKIESEGAKHVAALQKDVKSKKDLKLEGADWLGHLVALREDFRGVDSVEAYFESIGFDDVVKAQHKSSGVLFDAWYANGAPKKTFETVLERLDDAFLVEGLPAELTERMEAWKSGAKGLGIDAKLEKKYAVFESWKRGWKEGLERHRALWKEWKGP